MLTWCVLSAGTGEDDEAGAVEEGVKDDSPGNSTGRGIGKKGTGKTAGGVGDTPQLEGPATATAQSKSGPQPDLHDRTGSGWSIISPTPHLTVPGRGGRSGRQGVGPQRTH
jgi:hypothetical protein